MTATPIQHTSSFRTRKEFLDYLNKRWPDVGILVYAGARQFYRGPARLKDLCVGTLRILDAAGGRHTHVRLAGRNDSYARKIENVLVCIAGPRNCAHMKMAVSREMWFMRAIAQLK